MVKRKLCTSCGGYMKKVRIFTLTNKMKHEWQCPHCKNTKSGVAILPMR